MARCYSVDGQDTNTANTTILEMRSATTIRPRLYYFTIGSDATPADMAAEYNLQRTTTVGSGGSAVTPQLLDPGDPAALGAAREADTAEPTYTADAIMFHVAVNQRATFQWYAQTGREIVLPAAANGLGFRVVTTNGTPVNVNICYHYEE